jgi:cytohesin
LRNPSIDKAQEGTCVWVLENGCYQTWKTDREGAVLFLLGPSGCGKSITSTFVSTRLKNTENANILPFYCKDAEGSDKNPLIVESFIYRLLDFDRRLFCHIPRKYKQKRESYLDDLEMKADEVWGIFETILSDPATKRTFFFVDGLDECEDAFIEDFLHRLDSLIRQGTDNQARRAGVAKFMISCRPQGSVPQYTPYYPHVDLGRGGGNAQFVDEDIGRVVHVKLGAIAQSRHYSPELKDSIQGKILSKAKGVFLWVSVVLEILNKREYQANEATIHSIVDSLPIEMDKLYSHELEKIWKSSPDDFKQILKMALFSVRPLKSGELAESLTIRPNRRSLLDMQRFVNRDIGNWVDYCCRGLLKINKDTLELVHFSLREFLLSPRSTVDEIKRKFDIFSFNRSTCHLDMAKLCISYLLLDDFEDVFQLSEQDCDKLKDEHPFLSYAVICWLPHVRLCGELIDEEYKLFARFLNPSSKFYQSWDYMFRVFTDRRSEEEVTPILHHIAEHGLVNLCKRISVVRSKDLEKGLRGKFSYYSVRVRKRLAAVWGHFRQFDITADLDQDDCFGLTALDHACIGGHLDIVDLLLEVGASTMGKYPGGWTPFQIALAFGNEAVAERILKQGTNFRAVNYFDGCACAIHYASASGLLLIVQSLFLLDPEMDVDIRKSTGDTPLLTAVTNNRLPVVRYLLGRGADPGAASKDGRLPLHEAVQVGNTFMVKALLVAGANPNERDGQGITPIQYAAGVANPVMAQLLFERGAVVNAVVPTTPESDLDEYNIQGFTALHLAAQNGFDLTVRALLECGAHVKAKTPNGATALWVAAKHNCEEVVKTLIEAKSPLDEPLDTGETPLYSAVNNECLAVVRLLLERGARTDICLVESGISALHVAAWDNSGDIVETLLEYSANVEAKTKIPKDWTPLFPAARKGHCDVIQQLIDAGANPRAIADNNTPLDQAVSAGELDACRILLDKGATIKVTADRRSNALHNAARHGRTEIVSLILEKEPHLIDLETEGGGTALHYALANGHDEVVSLLINTGTSLKVKDNYGTTSLHMAAFGGNVPLIQRIMEEYGSAWIQNNDGYLPFHFACSGGSVPAVEFLLAVGADPGEQTQSESDGGVSPLHEAARAGKEAVARLLLDRSVDVNVRTEAGETPLLWASSRGGASIVKLLLSRGADPAIDCDYSFSCLHEAAYENQAETMVLLLDSGAPIDSLNYWNATPLQQAIVTFSRSAAQLLLAHGANTDTRSRFGRSTFEYILTQYIFSEDDLRVVWKDPSSSRRCTLIDTVIWMAQDMRQERNLHYRPLWHGLGKVLQFLGNEDDTQIAMQACIRFQENGGGKMEHLNSCTLCKSWKSIIGAQYMCNTCVVVCLCEAHMARYKELGGEAKGICRGHTFLKIPKDAETFDMVAHKAFDREKQIEWLQGLEERYIQIRDSFVVEKTEEPPETQPDFTWLTNWLDERVKNVKLPYGSLKRKTIDPKTADWEKTDSISAAESGSTDSGTTDFDTPDPVRKLPDGLTENDVE